MSYGYQDIAFSARRGEAPDMEQTTYPDIAPCLFWLIPPGFRVARRRDLEAAVGREIEDAEELLQAAGVRHANEIVITGHWSRGSKVATWIETATGDELILWQSGG